MRDRSLALLGLLVLASVPLLPSCATTSVDADCEAFGAHVEECTGSALADLEAYCAANGEAVSALAALSCEALDQGIGMADGFFGSKGDLEECDFNFECEGDLSCRTVFFDTADDREAVRHVCAERASHEERYPWRRNCDGWGDGDCAEGDVCYGGVGTYPLDPHTAASCESAMIGEPCSCPEGFSSCRSPGEGYADCGPDLACVEGTCRRECFESIECPRAHFCERVFAPIVDADGNDTGDLYVVGDFCIE